MTCLWFVSLIVPVCAAAPQAFYVSPNGSDANSGSDLSSPFLSLERARAAMQNSKSVKTTYLMGGLYNRFATLTLSKTDNGETWLAIPGQTPVLDGRGKVATGIKIDGATNVTIRWLTLQNFQQIGIHANDAPGFVFDSNTAKHITSTSWNHSAFEVTGSCRNGRITHNYIQDCGYCGIEVNAVKGDDITRLAIEFNAVYDTMKAMKDGGGIYVMDRGHSGAPVRIANNIIGNYGSQTNKSKAIYLDDQLSSVTVVNNIVWGAGKYCIQIHGGDHNVVTNNIFDISGASRLAYYQDASPGTNYGMAGNTFVNNIVCTTNKKSASSLWSFLNESRTEIAKPIVRDNIYWNPHATLPNTGQIVDLAPHSINPGFVDVTNHDYRFHAKPPFGFSAIDTSTVGPLPNEIQHALQSPHGSL